MDVCEVLQKLHKKREVDSRKQSSNSTQKSNETITRSSRTREVTSRYKSPTPSISRRCVSPNVTRASNASTQLDPKRAISAERKRPSTPPSPINNTYVEPHSKRGTTNNKLPELIWPSTMRGLSVSFQSDSISVPVCKKEKPVIHVLSDRTLKPSSNITEKQVETSSLPRKATPERRSPLKGKNSSHHSENSRPVDGLQTRLIDQHRWPSRAGGKVSSNALIKSLDLADKIGKGSGVILPSISVSSLRRLSAEGIPRPLHKTTSDEGDSGHGLIDEIAKTTLNIRSMDDDVLRVSTLHKLNLPKPSESPTSSIKSHSLPGSQLSSPSKASCSRGTASPSRTTPSTPTSSRGTSPSRIRPSSPTLQISNVTSIISLISDLKKGKKNNIQYEDAHHLRLLYNRYLQWRFANSQADAALNIQNHLAEETLYNVWRETLELRDSVVKKRNHLQQLQMELKLNTVLNEQLFMLEDWALLERDHSASLSGTIKDLESSTLRLPMIDGARVDSLSLKDVIDSGVDVMQRMSSSILSVLSKVQGTSWMVSELAELAAEMTGMLDECEAILASTVQVQKEEYSLRAQLMQHLKG